MKLNVKKLQKAGTIPLKQDYQFYKGQYDPELRRKMQVRAEANKPVNTTSEFIFDNKTMTAKRNPNAKMGLEIVSPEFQVLTAGVGSLGNKAISTVGKIGQTMLHGAGQGAMANMSNLSGSEQSASGLVQDVLGGAVVGGALKGIGLGAKPTARYALQKAEPYLLGDKKIPMSGYKPIQQLWNPFKKEVPISPKSNIKDLNKAQEFANKFGYNFPSNLERIAKSDKLTDMSIRGLMNRHNTFVRGVSTDFDIIEKKSPQILQHLRDKGINYKTNPQQAAEYMATHVPIETGYGRASLPGELLRNNKSAIYTSNSIPTAEGYTYGNGYIVKVKKPTDFSSPNRQDWINNNQLDYFENKIPLLNDNSGIRNKSVLNKYKPKVADDSKNLLRTERKHIITEKDLEGFNTVDELHDFAKSKIPKYDSHSALDDMDRNKFDELLKSGDTKALRDFRNNHIKKYIIESSKIESLPYSEKMNFNILKDKIDNYNQYVSDINLFNKTGKVKENILSKEDLQNELNTILNNVKPNQYAHYLHLGNQGDKILDIISSKKITPEIWKNKSRGHTNVYSRGLSMGSYVLPIAGLYGLTQSKKQGGKLIPKGQHGLLLNKSNILSPLDPNKQFNNSKFNFLNLSKQKPLLNFISIGSMGNIGYNSNVVLKLIDDFEGFKDKVYKDGKGIDTIGHGLTDKKYISKGTITKEESLSGVKSHIDKEVLPHLKNKPYWNNLNDNQKSALISYVFNIGSGNFNTKSPSLQKALSEGNWNEAAKQIDFGYNDKKNPGLRKRRDKERQLFLN